MERITAFSDEFFRLLKTIQITDILDILLVAFLIYQVISKTNTGRACSGWHLCF